MIVLRRPWTCLLERQTILDLVGLRLTHFNVQSLRDTAHFLQLKELVNTHKINDLISSETWLNTTVTSKGIEIEGLKLHHRLTRTAYMRKAVVSVHMYGKAYSRHWRKNLPRFPIQASTNYGSIYNIRKLSHYWSVSLTVLLIHALTIPLIHALTIFSNPGIFRHLVCKHPLSSWET